MKYIIAIIFSILCICSSAFAANDTPLNLITDKIENIKTTLNKEQSKRNQLQKKLSQAEINANALEQKLRKLSNDLEIQQATLNSLQKNTNQYQIKLGIQRKALAQQLSAAYMLGREPYIKLLLNQKDPETLSRIITYYSYISQQRIAAITDLQATLQKIKINQQKMQRQLHLLTKLKNNKLSEKQKLELAQNEREQLIEAINQKIQTKSEKLTALLINKHHLETTIRRLERMAEIQQIAKKNFASLRGHLRWPTKGRLMLSFGSRVNQSEIRAKNVLIKAPIDQPIHAIADGTVVFAKWLAGYGLLMIINHGNGYMTLYGRNHILYKQPGDIVHAGDQIASVGRTGGHQTPGLYFAIRHNANPLNPSHWCRRRALV